MEVTENRKVLRPVAGLTKSERRKLRNQERMRIAQLNAEDLDVSAGTSMYSVKDAVKYILNLLHVYLMNNVYNESLANI